MNSSDASHKAEQIASHQTDAQPARRLIVMRHAKSSWSSPGMADFDRPLNDRGRQAAPMMGARLLENAIQCDVVLASTACRVRQTLDLLLPAWKFSGPIVREKQLYLAEAATILKLIATMDDTWSQIMVVGHNPGLSELVSFLCERPVDMPTAAIAILDQKEPSSWQAAVRHRPWQQTHYWRPKDNDG